MGMGQGMSMGTRQGMSMGHDYGCARHFACSSARMPAQCTSSKFLEGPKWPALRPQMPPSIWYLGSCIPRTTCLIGMQPLCRTFTHDCAES